MVRQESHRVYWQQLIPSTTAVASSATDGVDGGTGSRRNAHQLITSSAAVRISDAAKAKDVTNLIRQSALNLPLSKAEQNSQEKNNEKAFEFFNPDDSGLDDSFSSHGSNPIIARMQPTKYFDALVSVATYRNLSHQLVQFEHEPPQRHQSRSPTNSSKISEPFHIVRTLLPHESPLTVRDKLLEKAKQKTTCYNKKKNSPPFTASQQHQLRWFFVPGVEPSGNVPNCIELDGYSTSMDDDDDDDKLDSDRQDQNDYGKNVEDDSSDVDLLVHDEESKFGGIICETSTIKLLMSREEERNKVLSWFPTHTKKLQKPSPSLRSRNQARRDLLQISQYRTQSASGVGDNCICGYLLKRSSEDIHVWKRVYCVLTDDHLWYVSRMYYNKQINDEHANHGKIELTKALLLEQPTMMSSSNNDSKNNSKRHSLLVKDNPLSRIPYVFEIVSSAGISHYFRTANETEQIRWMACISNKIVQCHDNKLIEHAELIVSDEAYARHKRLAKIISSDFSKSIATSNGNNISIQKKHKKVSPMVPNNHSINAVVQFGMEVAEYKERCRHIKAILPAKTTIVIRSDTNNEDVGTHRQRLMAENASAQKAGSSSGTPTVVLDNDINSMISEAWDIASALLATGTHISLVIKEEIRHVSNSNKSSDKATISSQSSLRSGSIDRACQHVEYVLSRQFRPSSSSMQQQQHEPNKNEMTATHQDDPPPADLFDLMLLELQKLADVV